MNAKQILNLLTLLLAMTAQSFATITKEGNYYIDSETKDYYKYYANNGIRLVLTDAFKAQLNSNSFGTDNSTPLPAFRSEIEYEGKTYQVNSLSSLFKDMTGMKSVNLSGWTADNHIASIENMFRGCKQLEQVVITGWNRKQLTNYGYMFYGCAALTEIDLSMEPGESKGTHFTDMLEGCTALTTAKLDYLVNAGPGSRGIMEGMFSRCQSLTTEGLSMKGWVTTGITNLNSTFSYCYSLTTLDLSGWDTQNVTTLQNMFAGEQRNGVNHYMNLTSINTTGWNTEKVTNLYGTFSYCNKLTSFDLSHWNTQNVEDCGMTFNRCLGLTDLNLEGWRLPKVTSAYGMFSLCKALTYDGGLKYAEVFGITNTLTNAASMFSGCAELEKIDLTQWQEIRANTTNMFSGCNKITSITFNKIVSTGMESMFNGCFLLPTIDTETIVPDPVCTSLNSTFSYCRAMTDLDLRPWAGKTYNVVDVAYTFSNMTKATAIHLEGIETGALTDCRGTFNECRMLEAVDVSGFNATECKTFYSMFARCFKLNRLDLSGDNWNIDVGDITDSSSGGLTQMFSMIGNSNTSGTQWPGYAYNMTIAKAFHARGGIGTKESYKFGFLLPIAMPADYSMMTFSIPAGSGLNFDLARTTESGDYSDLEIMAYRGTASSSGAMMTAAPQQRAGEGMLLRSIKGTPDSNYIGEVGARTQALLVSDATAGEWATADNEIIAVQRNTNATQVSGTTYYKTVVQTETDGHGKEWKCYILKKYVEDGMNVYRWVKPSAATGNKVASGKAYLRRPADDATPAKEMVISFSAFGEGEASAIAVVTTDDCDDNSNAVYNLQGQRMAKPMRGVSIIGGRKVVIR